MDLLLIKPIPQAYFTVLLSLSLFCFGRELDLKAAEVRDISTDRSFSLRFSQQISPEYLLETHVPAQLPQGSAKYQFLTQNKSGQFHSRFCMIIREHEKGKGEEIFDYIGKILIFN
jgi:hypothetical protein